MKNYVVYKHIFPDGSAYIGATSNYKKRWAKGSGYSYDKNLYSKILEFGWSNIEHIILHSNLNMNEAIKMESEEILKEKKENPLCLNKRKSGTFPKKATQETKDKISKAGIGRKQSDEFISMIKKLHTGNEYRKGAKASDETLKKMSEAHTGIKAYNHKRIIQYSLDMDMIKEWDCIMDVQRELGYLNNSIVSNLKGRTKKSYGFIWRYKDEQNHIV